MHGAERVNNWINFFVEPLTEMSPFWLASCGLHFFIYFCTAAGLTVLLICVDKYCRKQGKDRAYAEEELLILNSTLAWNRTYFMLLLSIQLYPLHFMSVSRKDG